MFIFQKFRGGMPALAMPALAMLALATVVLGGGFSKTAEAAYPQVRIHNFANVPVTVNILYDGCRHDTLSIPAAKVVRDHVTPSSAEVSAGHYERHHTHIWRWWKKDSPRGDCLVRKIDVSFHGGGYSADSYSSSGTSYSQFGIYQRSATRFRVMSNHEMKYEKETAGMSPGFKIHNKSTIPLTISLDQLGCLYYQNNVKPGQTFDRNTGAVWFTIKAKLYDPKQKLTTWACAKPIVELVGGALLAAATMGVGELVMGPTIAVAEAGTEAAATAAAENAAATLVQRMAQKTLAKMVISGGLASLGVAAKERLEANTGVDLTGSYAGPPWPARCKHKPEYNITGGPNFSLLKGLKTQNEVDEAMLKALTGDFPLKIRKIDGCK